MGPISLFDKSFIQSVSVDESVWFDNYFLANICPIFYVETLADLEKSVRNGRSPEQEVRIIADKFPEHGTPNAFHSELCLGNLLGYTVPMQGSISVSGGKPVKSDGESSIVYTKSPEADAFFRWQKQKFMEVEHLFAQNWRNQLKSLDLNNIAKLFRLVGFDGKSCKNLEEAFASSEKIVTSTGQADKKLELLILFFNIPYQYHRIIWERWISLKLISLIEFAPYAAYVFKVELFFQIALAANLISTERPSNRTDIAYLFYLPFCNVFVSSDNLHKRCTPFFLRDNQEFIWGQDLKTDLAKINEHYLHVPDSIKEKGIYHFAARPPEDSSFLVSHIWDLHHKGWREKKEISLPNKKIDALKLGEKISKIAKARPLAPHEVDFDLQNPDSITLERSIRKKKGSWYQLPKDLEESS